MATCSIRTMMGHFRARSSPSSLRGCDELVLLIYHFELPDCPRLRSIVRRRNGFHDRFCSGVSKGVTVRKCIAQAVRLATNVFTHPFLRVFASYRGIAGTSFFWSHLISDT